MTDGSNLSFSCQWKRAQRTCTPLWTRLVPWGCHSPVLSRQSAGHSRLAGPTVLRPGVAIPRTASLCLEQPQDARAAAGCPDSPSLPPGSLPVSVQFQPDPSSLPRSEAGSVEDRQGASAAPDNSHLWLVSDRSAVVQGGGGGGQREGTGNAPVGLRSGGPPSGCLGRLVFAAASWAFWALQPRPEKDLTKGTA